MKTILVYSLIFSLGLIAGQKLTMQAYDPKALEDNLLQSVRTVYTAGCSEGISIVTGKKDNFLFCLDLAEKTVKDQEDIIRNKAWSR